MRIVALGGDRVAVLGGRAVVNGTPLSEPYADLGDPASFTNTTREWSVPQGAVFLLGDSRANSVDSRLYGPVPVSDLVGPVTDIVVSAQLSRVGRSVGTPPGSR
jgi:signal peptidase I